MVKSLSNFWTNLIIEAKIENELLLINLYNANMENEQVSTLSNLSSILEKINDINNKSIVFGGDFNLFFETKLEWRGKPCTEEKNSSKTNANKRKI